MGHLFRSIQALVLFVGCMMCLTLIVQLVVTLMSPACAWWMTLGHAYTFIVSLASIAVMFGHVAFVPPFTFDYSIPEDNAINILFQQSSLATGSWKQVQFAFKFFGAS